MILQTANDNRYFSCDDKFLTSIIKKRKRDTSKDDYGRILLICGSKSYVGAPYFAAQGALRSGTGIAYLCIPDCIYAPVASRIAEPVLLPVASGPDGSMTEAALDTILEKLRKCDACLIGPGLSTSRDVQNVVYEVLKSCTIPLIIDADGINVLCGNINLLKKKNCEVILTPHNKEFKRLLNSAGYDYNDMKFAQLTSSFTKEFDVILLKKGYRTIISAPDYPLYVNMSGNPGMSKGGSGDILAGMITSLCGQNIPAFYAACAAAYIHGCAGDRCAHYLGEYGMTPYDMLKYIPFIFKDLLGC